MIYVVSGFFRSGTTMLMKALEAGGMPVYYSRERNALNEEFTNIRSVPNKGGLYEPSMSDLTQLGFPRSHDGCAVKIMISWLHGMAVHDYRVVVMRRYPRDVMEDYERTFRDFWDTDTRNRFIKEYPARINEAVHWFQNRKDVRTVNVLDMETVLENPRREFAKLDWPIDVDKAASVVWQPASRSRAA